jgi:oligopeptide/dipeptide ABC transporter ATP-binding protein
VILITHDLGVLAGMADRVLVMYAGRIVESAKTDQLYAAPQHPYTQGLLASIPRLTDKPGELHPIPGLPPDLSSLPDGCAFAARCPRASEQCLALYPEPTVLPENRMLRCYHPGAAR